MYASYKKNLKKLQSQSSRSKHESRNHKVTPDISAQETGSRTENRGSDVVSDILSGKPEAALKAEKKKAVRLFVSSTFTDTKVERNYLMREVYPEIRQLCQNNGVEFSIVDLRWGIRDTATNDHMTSEICLSEIEKCMTSSLPGAPCFMYLSFNRYGSPPLPRLVPAAEMNLIMAEIEDQEILAEVKKWYLKDDNACPPVYVLQPISTYLPEFLTATDVVRRKELRNEWYKLSDGMMTALQQSALQCSDLSDEQKMKWHISTTHDEVDSLLRCSDRKDRGLCYIRNIKQFNDFAIADEALGDLVWRFIDLDASGKIDKKVKEALSKLRQKVKNSGIPCRQFECDWSPHGISENTHRDFIRELGDAVLKDLKREITKAIDNLPKLDACTTEVISHTAFCETKSRSFCGREDLVGSALKYYSATGSDAPDRRFALVIYGVSGSGKTSLLSKLVAKAQEHMSRSQEKAVFVTRFCGTTPASSSARELLQSMSEQITRAYSSDPETELTNIPSDFDTLREYFKKCLQNATADQPLIIHIDSLDQLSDADNGRRRLKWLPVSLPEHVYLTVSTLPNTGGCFSYLSATDIPHRNYIEVPSLSKRDSTIILHNWLESVGRKLTKEQFDYVQSVALDESVEKATTLRLKLLFDITSNWTSYQEVPHLSPSVKGLINMIFDDLENTHGKAVVSCFCGLLGVSRLGLSENDLIDIMSTDDEVLNSVLQYHKPPIPRIPYHVFARLRNALGDYIIERGAHGKPVLYWYHRQFWETVNGRYLQGDSMLDAKYAGLIAKYYSEEVHKELPNRGLTPQPLYWLTENGDCIFNTSKLTELPNAIARGSDDIKELYKFIDLTFVAAKCSVGLAREMLSDFIASNTARMSYETKYFLSHCWFFFTHNVHVLEKEPQLILQQIGNLSLIPEEFGEIVSKIDQQTLFPWLPEDKLYRKCMLVNKPTGASPMVMTFSMEDVEGEICSLDVITIEYVPYAVVGLTQYIVDPKTKEPSYRGKLEIYDANEGVYLLSVPCDHAVQTLRLYKNTGKEFLIVYNSRDRLLRTVKVTLGETPTASHGPRLSLETQVLTSDLPDYDNSPCITQNVFALSHKDGRVAASAYGQVGTRSSLFYRRKHGRNPFIHKRYFHSVLKMWSLSDASASWETGKDFSVTPFLEIEPVLAQQVHPDTRDSVKSNHPGGYFVGSIAFSPDDRFIIMVLIAEDDNETLSPFLSICDSLTLQPLWSMNNVEPRNLASNVEHDQTYWLSCLGSEDGILYIAFASPKTVTCIAVNSQDPNNMQGKRVWGAWINVDLMQAVLCQLGANKGPKTIRALVTHPKGKMQIYYAPEIDDLGDPSKWNEEEAASEHAEYCRNNGFENDYRMPESLERLLDHVPLSEIGTDVKFMHVDEKGYGVTVSETGKITITDISKYPQYNQPEQHEHAIVSCCYDNSNDYCPRVYTGTRGGHIGTWDARSGKRVKHVIKTSSPAFVTVGGVVHNSPPKSDLLGYTQLLKISFQDPFGGMAPISSFTPQSQDVDGRKTYASLFKEQNFAPISRKGGASLDVSPDGRLFCASHPVKGNTHIVVGWVQQGDALPIVELEVCERTRASHFEGTYKCKFSQHGKHLAVYGELEQDDSYPVSPDRFPPQIKLFEMRNEENWAEVSAYVAKPNEVRSEPRKNPLEARTTLAFVPDAKHLVYGTSLGFVRLHRFSDLKVKSATKIHTDFINGIEAVSSSRGTFVVTCSADHWVKVSQVRCNRLHIMAVYYNAVEPLCITGFIDRKKTLHAHVGDTGGLLNVLRVDLKPLP